MAVAIVVGALALGAAPVLAAQRYTAPTPAGTQDCSSPANACSLETAIGKASKGDEVIIEPGSYGPLTKAIESPVEDMTVQGVDSVPGSPSATIHSEADYGIVLYGAGSTIRDLAIVDSGSTNGGSLALEGATGEQLVLRAGPKEGYACVLALTTVLRDSVCETESDGAAIDVSGTLDGPNDVTLRNVTAIAPNGDGIYAASNPFTERSVKMTVLNTIARGGTADIQAQAFTEPVSITTSHSNYSVAHTKVEDGASLTDDGTSQTAGNQTETQLFAEPLGGNFQEALGAQTIGAGLIEAENGTLDFYGYPRVFDSGGPCASTDIGAGQLVPAGGPMISTPTAGAVGETTASLSATADPLGGPGTAHFDYGAAAPGGEPPMSFSSTPVQCLPVSDVAQPVTSTITGLLPDTTYYYRLVAANESTTTTPPFTAKLTTAGLPSSTNTGTTPPTVTDLSQSAKTWREGNALAQISAKQKGKTKALPVGTTFTFDLNEAASVTFTFTTTARGRKIGKTCVTQTKHNRRKRGCTRIATAGTLGLTGHAGTNKVSFDGLIAKHHELKPGSYTLLAAATASDAHSATATLHFTIAR